MYLIDIDAGLLGFYCSGRSQPTCETAASNNPVGLALTGVHPAWCLAWPVALLDCLRSCQCLQLPCLFDHALFTQSGTGLVIKAVQAGRAMHDRCGNWIQQPRGGEGYLIATGYVALWIVLCIVMVQCCHVPALHILSLL